MGQGQPSSQATSDQVTESAVDQVLRAISQLWVSLALRLMRVGRDPEVTCLFSQTVPQNSVIMGERCLHEPQEILLKSKPDLAFGLFIKRP